MSKPAVLIIEDSASLALGYAAQLEEADYEVTLAATLAEAEDALATTRFAGHAFIFKINRFHVANQPHYGGTFPLVNQFRFYQEHHFAGWR